MFARHGRSSVLIGVVLGAAAAVIGWWATLISPSIIDDAANTLGQPHYPVGARLVLVITVMTSCAVAIWSRAAALVMATLALAFIGYSLLVFGGAAPALAPPDGWSSNDPVREMLYAVVIGGASIPLLLLAGLWLGIAAWWLSQRTRAAAGISGIAALFGLGLALAVVAWWTLPTLARAMTIMLYQGREAFSVLPSVLVLLLAAGSAWLAMRWPALGLGAAVAALCFAAYSLAVNDPPSGMTFLTGFEDWWSIRSTDLEESIRSTAFRPGTIELAAAWAVMAVAHLVALRPLAGRLPVARPSVAD